MAQRVIVVGAGQAGARTALGLRKEGWQGEIVLLGAEPDRPYERPPLSKEVLADEADALVGSLHPESAYADRDIQLRLSAEVTSVDLHRREVMVAGDERLTFDHLVLATGMRALPIPDWRGLDNVFNLRTAADARALVPFLQPGAQVVLIGGGFIGLEVAASSIRRGCRVTVLEAAPRLLGRVLQPELGDAIARLHRDKGVNVRVGTKVAAVEGRDRISAVRLEDGESVAADVVIVGIGSAANDEIARAAGIPCETGVLVDAASRTADPQVYAVGDVARQRQGWGGGMLRLESWENAEIQARAAATAIMRGPTRAVGVPWFWTDQFDMNLQILGLPRPGAEIVVRGELGNDSWCAFFLESGRLMGACLKNAGRDRRIVRQLIEEGVEVDRASLADGARPLRELLPRRAGEAQGA